MKTRDLIAGLVLIRNYGISQPYKVVPDTDKAIDLTAYHSNTLKRHDDSDSDHRIIWNELNENRITSAL